MKKLHTRFRIFAAVAGMALLAVSGFASADPPSRVARLGYASGAVSFSPAGEEDWVQATINRPLTTGDRLWADAGARAEVQVGGAMIRMNAATSVAVLNLDDTHHAAAIDAGHVERARAQARPQSGHRDRHAEPCLHRAATRRLPAHGGRRRQCDEHLRAQGPGRGVRRRRVVRGRRAAAVSLHGDRSHRVRAARRGGIGRLRSLGRRSRPRLRHLGLRALCFAGRDRLSGSRHERHVARRPDLRQRLVPESRGRGLGAVS